MIFGDSISTKTNDDESGPMILTEGYVLNKDNLEINVDDFKSGKKNVLLVTGLSGSGKSTTAETIAKQTGADWIELDIFEQSYNFSDDNLKEAGKPFYAYFNANKDIREKIKNHTLTGQALNEAIADFTKYTIKFCARDRKNKYVIEGVQIYSTYINNPEPIRKYPMIILGTSLLSSYFRRIKRSKSYSMKDFAKELSQAPKIIKWYFNNEKSLEDFTKGIIKQENFLDRIDDITSSDGYHNYIMNGNKEYAERHYQLHPNSGNKSLVPVIGLPNWIDKDKLQNIIIPIAKKILSEHQNDGSGDCPFKRFEVLIDYLNDNTKSETILQNILDQIPLEERLGFKAYQYNFEIDSMKCSIVLVTVSAKVLKIFYIFNGKLCKIDIDPDMIIESANDFVLPDNPTMEEIDINTILDNTPHNRIFITSDWHFFKNHYKREENYVNTQKILAWCKKHIKDNDVFIYLGDISFRYANRTDKLESQKLMASIPGIKILVLGNHDIMAGEDYFANCGFKYVVESIEWKDFVFTHKPINMETYPNQDAWNIHGHIHNIRTYNTSDGSRNINVYPMFYDNKPITLDYIEHHKESLVKNNKRSDMIMVDELSNIRYEDYNSIKYNHAIYEEYTRQNNAATVVYSRDVNSETIDYLVNLFKEKLTGNIGIKINVGEDGNENYLNPRLLSKIIKDVRGTFVDCNGLDGKRANTDSHMKLAEDHGFTRIANFDILDQNNNEDDIVLSIPALNRIEKAQEQNDPSISQADDHLAYINIGSRTKRYDSMIVYTHFTGNNHSGFSGAIKNLGVGMASSHEGGKESIDRFGKDEWGRGYIERLTESASAIQDYFNGHIIYINVLQNISTDSDSIPGAIKSKIPNIGVLISDDIVAIEQASIDFIRVSRKNKDLMDEIGSRGGTHQIEYAEWLGMGTRKYKLYDVKANRISLESALEETKRSELPTSAFGIPEDRKFPLDTEQHVRSAIKLFGHAEESKKKALAKRIRTAAKKYDIKIPETTQVYKYLTESADQQLIPSEVKNIVFDMGKVLVYDELQQAMADSPEIDNADVEALYGFMENIFFENTDDKKLQVCDIDMAKEIFKHMAPTNLGKYADAVFALMNKSMRVYPYVNDMLTMLRSKGYNIYYLSNWARYSYLEDEEFFKPLINKFDGGLFSYEVGWMKPDAKIYKYFLDKFNLDPSECIFFDDKDVNVEEASAVGMHGHIFDKDTTPFELFGCLDINLESVGNLFLTLNKESTDVIDINSLTWWYVGDDPRPTDTYEELYYPTLNEAIKEYVKDDEFEEQSFVHKYVFTSNGDKNTDDTIIPIPLGRIKVYDDKHYEWEIQYPLKAENGKLITALEYAMNSVNPVIGISKPFILKTGAYSDDVLDPPEYAFSPDIIADEYLVVDENAHLKLVNSSYFNEQYVEEYEFVGNKYLLKKILEAYKNQATVDNTFFYTALTGKPMLSEDQIDFDKSFKKVDFELMKEKQLSAMATQRDQILEAMHIGTSKLPIEESFIFKNIPFFNKYNKYNEFCIREDYDGYYFYNKLSGNRTASVAKSDMLTEAMIKSIL